MLNLTEDQWEYELYIFRRKYEINKLYEGPNADLYFEYFGAKFITFPPRNIDDIVNGIKIYKEILKKIKEDDEEFYEKIHKGTPFFYIGWLSFLLKNYEEAIYYIDAAMNEDKKNHPADVWPRSGAALFLMMDSQYNNFFKEFSDTTIPEILEDELDRFSSEFEILEVSEFQEYFIKKILFDNSLLPCDTAIITTFYSFILEKDDILDMINLRGTNAGTIEPMIIHLFKGALVFETLIKKFHPELGASLSQIFQDDNIQELYNIRW